jgi:hypothetical protein
MFSLLFVVFVFTVIVVIVTYYCFLLYCVLIIILVKRPFCGAVHRRKLAFSRKHFHNAFLMK